MKNKKNISDEELKEIVLEVLDYFQKTKENDENDGSEFLDENLFITPYGQAFLEGVRNMYEFVSKGVVMTGVMNFYSLLPEVFNVFSGGEIVEESSIKNNDKELLEIMNKVVTHPEVLDQLTNNISFFEKIL